MDLNRTTYWLNIKKIQEAQATVNKTHADLKRSEIELERVIAESNRAPENKPILEQIEIGNKMNKISAEFSKANDEHIEAIAKFKKLIKIFNK